MNIFLPANPVCPENYLQRAIIRYCHAESDGAAEDCFRAIQLDPNLGSSPKYGPFLLCLASTESQNSASGGPRLSDHIDVAAAATLKDWNSKVAAFLPDKISEADFLVAAASPDSDTNRVRHCQAWYYTGMRRWRDGDKITAIDDFEKSITTGKDTLFEYLLSRHQLGELDRSEKKSDDFRSGFRPSLKIESSDH